MSREIAIKVAVCLLLAALAIGLLFATVHGYELWRDGVFQEGDAAGAARVQRQWDADRAQAQAQAIERARQAAAETLRRLNVQQENQRAQDALLAQVRRDRDAAVAAADGLQLRASAYLDAAGCGAVSGDTALECIRTAATALADALGRSAAIAQRAAAAADDARTRGLKCEADYDSLN